MTIKRNLLLLHWCVLLGQHQAAACGTSGASLPVAPQGDDPCAGPHWAGSGSSLCDCAPCPVTAPQPGSGYGAVSSDQRQRCASPAQLIAPRPLFQPCALSSLVLSQK